jgi:hypothetical protein
VAQISQERGIHHATLYYWKKWWQLQGWVLPASKKDPEDWSAANKHTVVLEIAGFNAIAECLLQGKGAQPRAIRPLDTSIQGCLRETSAHLERTGVNGETPRPGAAGN